MGMVTPHGAIQAFNNHLSAPRSLSTPAQQTPGHLDSASMHNTLMGMSSSSSKEGGSNEETLLTFPPNWLPEERGKINTEWAKLWWRLAHSLSKKLPETDAKNEELEEFCNLGRSIWDHTRNQLNDRLLEHLRMKCLQLDIAAATDDEDANTSIANIHGAVMRCWDRDTMSRDDFLRKVLAIVLVPLTKDKYQWLIRVKTDVQARWKFRLAYQRGSKDYIEAMAGHLFNCTVLQRLRRGLKRYGFSVYVRVPKKLEKRAVPCTFRIGVHTVNVKIVEVEEDEDEESAEVRAGSDSGAKLPPQVEPAPEEDVGNGSNNFSPNDSSEDRSFTELQRNQDTQEIQRQHQQIMRSNRRRSSK